MRKGILIIRNKKELAKTQIGMTILKRNA